MKFAGALAAFLCAAALSHATISPAGCRDLIQQALDSKNPDTRKSAVVALSLGATDNAMLKQLAAMLDDKDVEVRVAVVTSLSEIRNRAATNELHKALRDPVPEVSFAAAKALYARGDAEGRDALLSVLAKETKPSSGFITSQMRTGLRMMHTPRTTFLYALRQGLGFVPLPGFGEGVASMQALLADPGVSGRASAALLLGKDHDSATIDGLKDALYDKDWHVRAAAVHALALQNNPALMSDLALLTLDDREEVRLRAAAGWLRLNAIETHRRRPRPAPAATSKN
jgi:HEAT repeat protein